MTTRYYTADEVRERLTAALKHKTQAQISREAGVQPQHISLMVKGAPIGGKVLAWLGFRKTERLYERVK